VRRLGILFLCIVVGAALRLRGVATDFWLDEIWTLQGVLGLTSPIEVVTRFHSENNHILNSLWLWWLGDRHGWYAYRIPALLAGVASIPLAWLALERSSRTAAAFAAALVSTAYLQVLWGSEARGYAPMIAFGLAALVAAPSITDGVTPARRRAAAAAFVVASIAGVLSHLLYAHWYAGIAAGSAFAFWRGEKRAGRGLLVAAHAIVIAAFAAMWLGFARHLPSPTGPIHPYLGITVDAASLAFGGPSRAAAPLAAALVALAVVAVVVAELVLSFRGRAYLSIALGTACFLAPGAMLLVARPDALFVRYFAVSIVTAQLLVALFCARLWRGPRMARAASVLLFVLVLAGQAAHLERFREHGRGHYLAAMRHIAAATEGEVATIGSDHNVRNGKVVWYYARFLPDKQLVHTVYLEGGAPPDWWLLHRFDGQADPAPILRIRSERYRRTAVFPHGSLSGWTWFVYRRWPTGNDSTL
jgi:hypothetical protein